MDAPTKNPLQVRLGTGYGLDQGGTRWRSSLRGRILDGKTSNFQSLESLLQEDFSERGFIPETAVLALPGTYQNGRFEFTNLNWPSVTTDELSRLFGTRVTIINDMQAAQLGAGAIDRGLLTLLKDGNPHPSRYLTMLTLSTGVNWASGHYDASLPLAREQGHVRLAVDPDSDAALLDDYVSRKLGHSASIEDLLSGSKGVNNIVNFVLSTWGTWRDDPLVQVSIRRSKGEDCALLMTQGVLNGDAFWVTVAELYGECLAYLINQIVVGELVGELIIQGSVLNGTPGFAEWLFNRPMVKHLIASSGMEKSFIADEVKIYGVPADVEIATMGAERLAQWVE